MDAGEQRGAAVGPDMGFTVAELRPTAACVRDGAAGYKSRASGMVLRLMGVAQNTLGESMIG